jgi:hypothetical protein
MLLNRLQPVVFVSSILPTIYSSGWLEWSHWNKIKMLLQIERLSVVIQVTTSNCLFYSAYIYSNGLWEWSRWKNIQMLLVTERQPVIVQVTTSGSVYSILPTFTATVGWSAPFEIIYKCCRTTNQMIIY